MGVPQGVFIFIGMTSFISEVLDQLYSARVDLKRSIFVLPNKRAAVFLKKELSKKLTHPILSPEIFSIEEFIEQMSEISVITQAELLFEFFTVYQLHTPKEEQEPFEAFLNWAPTVLQDFNEIDRFLVDPEKVFGYLKAIKDLEHWSLSDEPTSLMTRYLKFWERLGTYYHALNESLVNRDLGYQGMAFRNAVDQIEPYLSGSADRFHIFMGFNALNKAESLIIQELLNNEVARIFWDTDKVFHQNKKHAAGLYTRSFKNHWPYYKNHSFDWVGDHYSKVKKIDVIGVPKQVGQAKYVGQLLGSLNMTQEDLSKTAIVLGEESLLLPLLTSIPEGISEVNITMGLPLQHIPIAHLFESLFRLHKKQGRSFYYKDVIKILSHSSVSLLMNTKVLLATIHANNKIYITPEWLLEKAPEASKPLSVLFDPWDQNAAKALTNCHELIQELKIAYQQGLNKNRLALEYLYRFYSLFNKLSDLQSRFGHFQNLEAVHQTYKELLRSETLDFKGEPLRGLQIMGMLESRVLDYETVIITSVNEGILPAGKSQNSTIPFELKLEYKLPTYKEKDAVYTYHFYRLLQRAKNIYLIYDTEIDALFGGEKSRFITQLEVEKIHEVSHRVASPSVVFDPKEPKQISKSNAVLSQLYDLGTYGFSPSALTQYIRNPIDFYHQYVLSIKDADAVEEYIAANTLGTILHDTLEQLFLPFKGTYLTEKGLKEASLQRHKVLEENFVQHYGQGNFDSGKNLIVYEVAKQYLLNFLKLEMAELQKGTQIRIIALERKSQTELSINGLKDPVFLRGTVDRIDEVNGELRIIDYKTGATAASDVQVLDWSALSLDYKKSKAFQLLFYAYIYWKSEGVCPKTAGIISFRNLRSGVLSFGTKPSPRGKVNDLITEDTLLQFEELVTDLILEILNKDQPFIEKEV